MNFTGVTTTSISATASGNVNLSIPVMADWENDSAAATPLQTTTSFSGLAVNNLTMSAPTSNTARLTKTGISGNVDVVKYLASMAPAFNFTRLISVDGDDYAFANGEWTVTWNDYGTVRGTSMCSSKEGTPFQTGNPSSAEGSQCWCKMTGWTPNDGNETPMSSLWVFEGSPYRSPADCQSDCANECGGAFCYSSDMRSPVLGSVQTSTGFNFTTLINDAPNDSAYKSAIYPDGASYNEAGLSNGEWTVRWNIYGTVKGTSMCSSTEAIYGQTGNPSNTEGKYCWCKMTAWTPKDGTETPVSSLWVGIDSLDTADGCAYDCADACDSVVAQTSDFRSALFGSVQ